MAGHSKWSNIKHKKNINDKKKSKLFSKITNEIKTSLKDGENYKNNIKLKNAINKAITHNIKKNIIKKLIDNKEVVENKSNYIVLETNNKIVIIIEYKNEIINLTEFKKIAPDIKLKESNFANIKKFFDKVLIIKIKEKYNEKLITFNKNNYIDLINNKIKLISNKSNNDFIIFFLKIKNYEKEIEILKKICINVDNKIKDNINKFIKKYNNKNIKIFTNII